MTLRDKYEMAVDAGVLNELADEAPEKRLPKLGNSQRNKSNQINKRLANSKAFPLDWIACIPTVGKHPHPQ